MFSVCFILSFLSCFLTYYYEYPIKPNDLEKKKHLARNLLGGWILAGGAAALPVAFTK